ncbi:MAG: hypothetical protein ACR2JJ_11275 [Sphingomicrobium sp.]
MDIKAALLAVFTIVMLVAVLAVASIVSAYPELGAVGWPLVAVGIGILAIPFILIFRTRSDR